MLNQISTDRLPNETAQNGGAKSVAGSEGATSYPAFSHDDLYFSILEDKPGKGMWHCGPNPCWITVTHKPTMASVRVYSGGTPQHRAREEAIAALEMIVGLARGDMPAFHQSPADPTPSRPSNSGGA